MCAESPALAALAQVDLALIGVGFDGLVVKLASVVARAATAQFETEAGATRGMVRDE